MGDLNHERLDLDLLRIAGENGAHRFHQTRPGACDAVQVCSRAVFAKIELSCSCAAAPHLGGHLSAIRQIERNRFNAESRLLTARNSANGRFSSDQTTFYGERGLPNVARNKHNANLRRACPARPIETADAPH